MAVDRYGSTSPFFILFKTLEASKDDEVLAAILSQRDAAIRGLPDDHDEPGPPPPGGEEPAPTFTAAAAVPVPQRQPPAEDWRKAPNAADLPVAWKRLKDDKGREYFFNVVTKESKWSLPSQLARAEKEKSATWARSKATVEIEI